MFHLCAFASLRLNPILELSQKDIGVNQIQILLSELLLQGGSLLFEFFQR